MARLEELQQLWQSQPARGPAEFDLRGLTGQLRCFGRQQTYINSVKLILLAATFVRMTTEAGGRPLALGGIVLMYIGFVTYLVLDWRNQIGISRLDFSTASVEFVHQARERLRNQLDPMRRVFWLLVVTVGGGFNLLLFAQPHGPLVTVIALHMGATALPFAGFVWGIKIREFRFRRECGAVIERLEELVRALEEEKA